MCCLLAEDRAEAMAAEAHLRLGYSSMQLGMQAACVGLYLVDLLHLKSIRSSPMYLQDPEAFLAACDGEAQHCQSSFWPAAGIL